MASNPWAISPRNRVRRSASVSSTSSGGHTVRAHLSPPPSGRAVLDGGGDDTAGYSILVEDAEEVVEEPPDRPSSPNVGEDVAQEAVVVHSRRESQLPPGRNQNGLIPDDSYGQRLREVLYESDEEDAGPSGSRSEEGEVHAALDEELDPTSVDAEEDEFGEFQAGMRDDASDKTPSTASVTSSRLRQLHQLDGQNTTSPSRRSPFLPPNVSRLRSHTRFPSTSSTGTTPSLSRGNSNPFLSPSMKAGSPQRPVSVHSHFSAISRSSSYNALTGASRPSASDEPGRLRLSVGARREDGDDDQSSMAIASDAGVTQGPSFVFHPLRKATSMLWQREQEAASASSATSRWGSPTVIAVNGMVAVGMTSGFVVVVGFGQELRTVCGTEAIVKDAGAVTALAISPDQTYVAVGHANGYIYLYDLLHPTKPVRSAPALTPQAVRSGRKEGHIVGSKVLHVDFVGKRHTAIISGDEHGRAFWWSLGKVMGVESNDVVRLLGSYDTEANGAPRRKSRSALLAATPLPLGSRAHPTDNFTLMALMTPTKLVIVGLKPSPRTWFRKVRPSDESHMAGSRGAAAWLAAGGSWNVGRDQELENGLSAKDGAVRDPVLAYSWGKVLRLLTVKVVGTTAAQTSNVKSPNRVEFVEGKTWQADDAIVALRWYGPDGRHLLVITRFRIELLSLPTMTIVESAEMDAASHMTPFNGSTAYLKRMTSQHVSVYKGKVFILQPRQLSVGALLLWSDRLLALCQGGDFLGAIRLAVAYYHDEAPGTRIGLPDDETRRRQIVGQRVVELVQSSVNYAFSEDRALDGTYDTPDGRGVDLTSMFEDLAATSVSACLAVHRTDLIYDDIYERFSEAGIQGIFLDRLQEALVSGSLSDIPPSIVQALIARHQEQGNFKLAEMIIWHVSPAALDINQAIRLCEKHGLWDALIYVYNCCLADYIAPLNRLMDLVTEVLRARAGRPATTQDGDMDPEEASAPAAYKVYAYLEHILTGVTYPDGKEMDAAAKATACGDLYAALFAGRYDAANKEVGYATVETPYRHLHALLTFDAESLLHVLDLAFEDSYLNGSSNGRLISRQVVVNILLELAQIGSLAMADRSFIHIFIARNLPKYPQFIFIPPSTLHNILVDLTMDDDLSTREDRELAVEYLLSAYTPHDVEVLYELFHQAGFYRLLRMAYERERRWPQLIHTLVEDPDARSDLIRSLQDVVHKAKKAGAASEIVSQALRKVIPVMLDVDIQQTAVLLQDVAPGAHGTALEAMSDSSRKQMAYLRALVQPENDSVGPIRGVTSVDPDLRNRYLDLLIRESEEDVVAYLDQRGPAFFDLEEVAQVCSSRSCPQGLIWSLDKQDRITEAFEVVTGSLEERALTIAKETGSTQKAIDSMQSVVRLAIKICRERETSEGTAVSSDELWYQLLRDCLTMLQVVDSAKTGHSDAAQASDVLRGLMQETLSNLMTATSARSRAFPQLFKRLVDSTLDAADIPSSRAYAQFRTILSGMLESYAGERDTLELTTRLISADLFECIKELHLKRQAGWKPSTTSCTTCGKALAPELSSLFKGGKLVDDIGRYTEAEIMIHASGEASHVKCLYASAAA